MLNSVNKTKLTMINIFTLYVPLTSHDGCFRALAALFFVLPLMVTLLMERKKKSEGSNDKN